MLAGSALNDKRNEIERETARLMTSWVHPHTPQGQRVVEKLKKPISREYSLAELLKRPELQYADLAGLVGEPSPDPQASQQVEIQAKYAGYIERQKADIARLRANENTLLPTDIDYDAVDGLSNEVKQKLSAARPDTLARAGRIPGVTAAAIALLLIYLKKRGDLGKRTQGDTDTPTQVGLKLQADLSSRLQQRLQ